MFDRMRRSVLRPRHLTSYSDFNNIIKAKIGRTYLGERIPAFADDTITSAQVMTL